MDWKILRSMFKNIYNTLYSCQYFPAGSRQAARGAHICETSLLSCVSIGGGGVIITFAFSNMFLYCDAGLFQTTYGSLYLIDVV